MTGRNKWPPVRKAPVYTAPRDIRPLTVWERIAEAKLYLDENDTR